MKEALAIIPIALVILTLFSYNYTAPVGDDDLNLRPIIAVLAQPGDGTVCPTDKTYTSYIAASYIKFVEGMGARAVPLRYDQSEEDMLAVLDQVDGALFPGGDTLLYAPDATGKNVATDYLNVQGLIVKTAIAKKDKGINFPVFGICLGFEALSLISMEELGLDNCLAPKIAVKQTILDASTSRVLTAAPEELVDAIANQEIIYENHEQCVTPDIFNNSESMTAFWTATTTVTDPNDKVYVNSIEAKNYPIYGFQYHPEKAIYEWTTDGFIPHAPLAVKWTQFLSDFFGAEARQNPQSYKDSDAESKALIYNYEPIYSHGYFEQIYCFE